MQSFDRATDHHSGYEDCEGETEIQYQRSIYYYKPTNNSSSWSSIDLNKLKINNLHRETNELAHE